MKNSFALTIVLALVVGGLAFFGGMKYQLNQTPSIRQSQGLGNRQFQGRNANSQRPLNGEIVSVDDKSITVKLQDGSSKIVLLSANTKIDKTSEAKKEDLKTGEKVAAFGTVNSDGSVTANNVQLNPLFFGMNTTDKETRPPYQTQ